MFTTKIQNGVIGGLAGGAVFGMMMAMMGMLPMIGSMIGLPNSLAGFVVHMIISSVIGATYGFLLGGRVRSTSGGLFSGGAYGTVWWLLGPLTLMPLFMGMGLGVNWNAGAATKMLPSLMGHAIFGVVLGFTFARLTLSARRNKVREPELSTVDDHA